MPTNPIVPGPSRWYVGTGVSAAMVFLGWTEQDTQINLDARFGDVRVDLAGPEMPFDRQFFGEWASISGALSKFDENVLRSITCRTLGSTPGSGTAGSIGSMMRSEGLTWRLIIASPYTGKTINTLMDPVWNFPACYLADQYSFNVGTNYKRAQLVIAALPVINNDGSWTTYTNVLGGVTLPAVS